MTVPTSSTRTAAPRRAGQILLSVLLAVCGLVAVGTAFSDDPFPRPAIVLIATFGPMATVLGIGLVWSARGLRTRLLLWVLPLFFVAHVALLGTWLPDAGFALLAAVGTALVHAPDRRAAIVNAAA